MITPAGKREERELKKREGRGEKGEERELERKEGSGEKGEKKREI